MTNVRHESDRSMLLVVDDETYAKIASAGVCSSAPFICKEGSTIEIAGDVYPVKELKLECNQEIPQGAAVWASTTKCIQLQQQLSLMIRLEQEAFDREYLNKPKLNRQERRAAAAMARRSKR